MAQEEAVKDGKDGASSVIPWTVPRSRFGPKDKRPTLKGGRAPSVLDQLDGELEKRVLAPAPTEHAPAAARPVASRLDGKPPQSAAEEVAAARLRQLERLLRTQEEELRRQEREISQLQADKFGLQRDNREMQLFLADYGMRWVGGVGEVTAASGTAPQSSDGSEARGAAAGVASRATCDAAPSASCSASASSAALPAAKGAGTGGGTGGSTGGGTSPTKAAAGSPAGGSASMPPDMDVVRRAVHELNELADSSAEVVQCEDGSHRLQQSQPTLSLIFWRNGMEVQGGELRPYGTPQCTSFLKDLLDGFFPYELKYAFPDGVIFSVQDRSHVDDDQPEHTWGQGRRLDSRGGGAAARGGAATRGGGAGASLLGIDAGRMLSLCPQLAAGGAAAELVAELVAPAPAEVPAAPTAAAAAAAVAPVAAPAAAVAAPAAAAVARSSEQAADGDSGDSGECRLQIKDSSGGVACVMTLPSKATLAEVHQQLHTRGVVDASAPYELRTSFPARVLGQTSETLHAANLTPSAMLFVRTRGLLT